MAISKAGTAKKSDTTIMSKDSIIEKLVTDHFVNSVSVNDTARELIGLGLDYLEVNHTIKSVGKKLGLVLTEQEIFEAVQKKLDGCEKPLHMLDLIDLVNDLEMPAIDNLELTKAAQKVLGTNLSGAIRYKSLTQDSSSKYGKIGAWAMENLMFTPSELIAADILKGDAKAPAYYDEFLSFQRFFRVLGDMQDTYAHELFKHHEEMEKLEAESKKSVAKDRQKVVSK